MLWAGTIAFGGSTVALLAVLSRHDGHTTFASLAALLSLAFVVSLIPAGVQLRSASLVADGRPTPAIALRQLLAIATVSLAVAPLLALLLRVPVAAAALVSVQMVVAIPLAARQGALLGVHRFTALGSNLLIEGAVRFGAGAAFGLVWGVTGLAAGIFLGTATALLVLPRHRGAHHVTDRPRTSLLDTSMSLALLGLYVQLDILIAPSVVAPGGASTYDLAAVPAKGVYLALLAAGPMLFPFVRRRDSEKALIVRAAALTFALGVASAVLLVACRPLIARVLDQPEPRVVLLATLGLAMTFAGETAMMVNAAVARGVRRPWPPLAIGIVVLLGCWPFRPTADAFAIVVLVTQVATALAGLCICLRARPGPRPAGEVPVQVQVLAEGGQSFAIAEAAAQLEGRRTLADDA
jgi:hypothetical protein